MRAAGPSVAVLAVLGLLVLSSTAGSVPHAPSRAPSVSTAFSSPPLSSPTAPGPRGAGTLPFPSHVAPTSATSRAFDQRVRRTASLLTSAGVPAHSIRLPYVGPSAQVVDGAVVPGYAISSANVSAPFSSAPAPSGLGYYGLNDTSGKLEATTVNASGVAGTLTIRELDALYLDVDTPDMWGIQLNAVLGNVTLHGVPGNEFWVQNAVDVFQHNDTIDLGEDTWNFSSPTAYIANDTSTVLSHDPNGSVIGGLYIGAGPWIHAPTPFTLTLYVNSSLTPGGDQKLWYNYSLTAAGGIHRHGNYDWLVFNSQAPGASVSLAPFQASGTQLDPVGLTNDFEFDFPIGGYNGANMDILSANLSATLDYCPVALASCTAHQLRSVPAAENFGGETGESSVGLSETYAGTTATATAGPFILRGLWGFPGAQGSAAGSTPVTNAITVSSSPDPSTTAPYVFVFLSTSSYFDGRFEWAPDVPVWHLAPGTYSYEVLLADYAEQTGTLVVGGTATSLAVNLPYHRASGVYTPLWALSNAQLAGISVSGDGTVSDQYLLFNNPTAHCTQCGGAVNGNLSRLFLSANDYVFPSFSGILFVGTDAYVDIDAPVAFCVLGYTWGGGSEPRFTITMDLQIELYSTEHVTLSDARHIGGWPAMYETSTLAGFLNASENVFPQASVMIWNSTDDLVMENSFVSTVAVPAPGQPCGTTCSEVVCFGCVSPDELLLYGGTHNTVWGNTFQDPAGAAESKATYAGLAQAENGDLIYNNNFSVDNPTVYLPFDIYTDACPDGYAGDCGPLVPPNYQDRWNVTSQPAASDSATVNGFPLSGSILGPTCSVQGGNYWANYGNPLNPTSSVPYTDVYNYSELSTLLPPRANPDQPSIRVGGDYAPLSRASCPKGTDVVHFRASGLVTGLVWGIRFQGGYQLTSFTQTITVPVLPGTIVFQVVAPAGFGLAKLTGPGSPTISSATISRASTTLKLKFGVLEPVVFEEVTSKKAPGLPPGTRWSVSLAPSSSSGAAAPPANSTTSAEVWFLLPTGAHFAYVVSAPAGYKVSGGHGRLVVPAHEATKPVRFRSGS